MALLFIEGFETEENIAQNWNVLGSQPTWEIVVNNVRSGLRSMKLTKYGSSYGYQTSMQKYITNDTTRLCVSFVVNLSRISNNNKYIFAMGNDDRWVKIYTKDGYFKAYGLNSVGLTEYLLQSGASIISANTWYPIEIEYINGSSDGTVKAQMDYTTPLFDITSSDLNLSQNPNWVEFRSQTTDDYQLSIQLDDIYIFNDTPPDNTFLGCVSIAGSRVVNLGQINDFTAYGNTTKPYKNLKEMFGDTTTYLYSTTPGQVQLFDVESLPSIGDLIAVQTAYHVAKYDEFSGDVLADLLIAQDSTTFHSESVLLTDHEFENFTYIYRQNPLLLTDQTSEDYNNYQLGIKFIS